MFKSILRQPWMQNSLAAVLALYMAIVKRTTRWTVQGGHYIDPLKGKGEGFIFCCWHGRVLLANCGYSNRWGQAAVLVSQSRDGDFITRVGQFLGLEVIRGSTRREGSEKDRGGSAALRDMVRHIKKGGAMVVTPDGPRGPMMQTGDGPLWLGKMTGAKVLPYAVSLSHRKLVNSWDRAMIPFPFGRGVIVWGEPVRLERGASPDEIEAARALLEERMVAASIAADTAIGKEVVLPGSGKQKRISPTKAQELS